MNEIINKFLLLSDKFIPEMQLKQLGSIVVHLPKIKKKYKNLCKLKIQVLFIEMNLIKLVFNLIWLMVDQKI